MENKVFVSKNDRSKWPARAEFDRSSPRSGRTLSADRPLFAAQKGGGGKGRYADNKDFKIQRRDRNENV